MQVRNRGWIILALFFCSGATALVYEVVWSKFLSQMFGSTVYAQTVVLATFMGGLALGNKLFGRWADGLAHPVRAYGWLEIGIGLYAILFPWLDRLVDWVFVAVGSGLIEHAGALLVLKATLSALLLITPTVLMGGTLPLMAAWLQKSDTADAGRRSARFYSVNSLGAVTGSALAGFFLVQSFGLIVTLQIAAAVNVLIGIAAIIISREVESAKAPPSADSLALSDGGRAGVRGSTINPQLSTDSTPLRPQPPTINHQPSTTLRWAGLIVALTGGVSMGFEVLSARSLALIFGSSLQSFAVVLIAFILGIGLGAAWIASSRRRRISNEALVVILLCLAAAWVAFLVLNIEKWVDFYRIARTGLARTPAGYVYHQLLTVGMSLVVLGLPAAWVGAVLPLMIRAVSAEDSLLGKRVGALLTWNTLGCVVGTLFTGFVLMPMLGLRNAFAALALLLVVAAAVLAWRARVRFGLGVAAAAGFMTLALFVQGDTNWRHVMSSGVFRIRETEYEPRLMPFRKEHVDILHYEDGPDATVCVEQTDGVGAPVIRGLRINGKPDAGTGLDFATQLLVGHLPIMAKPQAKDVFVLGLASGMTAGAILEYPIDRLDIAENCVPVIKASRYFDDWNRNALKDPRTKLWVEDARTVLKLRSQQYDVIITEPSNPWTVGVGSIFSREFYELVARRLKPGGIVAQWFHTYETDNQILEVVLRTFGSVFPHMEIWDAGTGDIIILGSLNPWMSGTDSFRSSFALNQVRTDMAMIDIHSPEALWARQMASQATAFAIPGPGPIQFDHLPLIEYAAPRSFYLSPAARLLDFFDERTYRQLLASAEKRSTLAGLSPENVQLIFGSFTTVNIRLLEAVNGTAGGAGMPCVFVVPNPVPAASSDGSIISLCSLAVAQGDLLRADQMAAYALQQQPNNLDAAYLKRIIDRRLGRHFNTEAP
jgi:spermidine synthase